MKKSLQLDNFVLTIWRLLAVYITLIICHIIFYFYNRDLIHLEGIKEVIHLFPGILKFDTPSILYANILWLFLSLLPLRIRTVSWYRKGLYWTYIVTNTLAIIVLNLTDTIYFRYTQKRLTMEELHFANNDNTLSLMGQFALENWVIIVTMVLMAFGLSKAYLYNTEQKKDTSNNLVYYLKHSLIMLVSVFFILGGIRGGLLIIHKDTRPITLSNAAIFTTDAAKVNLILSNPFCLIRTMGYTIPLTTDLIDQTKVDSLFTPYHYPGQYLQEEATKYEGYNIVILILESFSAENSAYLSPHLYNNGENGYMPFLDSLMQKSLVMKNMYANGVRSIQAMPAILGSTPSLVEAFISMSQSLGESRHLPKMLREKGYSTSFFFGSTRHSMGFAAYAKMAGVDIIKSREDYEERYGTKDYDSYWGIWDEPFLQFFEQELSMMKEPFMSSLFTLNAHHPFKVPTEYESILPKGKTKVQRGTAYDDMALRKFFEKSRNEEWFNRTIFVITSDHVSSEKMAEETMSYPGNHRTVGLIYTADESLKQEVNDVTQQLDIMPTLLGLIGNKEPYFAYGRDIINEKDRPKWSISYNGNFVANTNDRVITIDDSDTLKAAIQQYYHHISKSSFVAPDHLSDQDTLHLIVDNLPIAQ